jgi:hypothetical protein
MRLFMVLVFALTLIGIGAAQDTDFSAGPQYLVTTDSTQFLRPISTPNISLDAGLPAIRPLPEIGPTVSDQPYVSNPALQNQANLFPIYYGYPMIMVVEVTSTETPRELPASITGVGYATLTDAETLRELGYGVTVGEAASYWKSHKSGSKHVYTNADIERLHRS